jgi:biopolymer transport protein ExbD
MSPVMHFGGGKTAKEVQHDTVKQLTPPALVIDNDWRGAVRTAKIRVWADDDYRAQNGHWQQAFQAELDRANEVLSSEFGVHLEAEYRAWHHHAIGDTLADSLEALAREDPGGDVLTVVGLTSSLSIVSATFDQLGLAEIGGAHLVLRGYADVEERRSFDRVFINVPRAEREAMYEARRRHRTTAIILHELGHNLGALHRADADTLMSAMYSERMTAFDPVSHATILATLDERLGRPPTPAAEPDAPDAAHTTLVIDVDARGQHLVGGNAVDDPTLDDLLHMSVDDDRDTAIVVRYDPMAPQRAVSAALEHARKAGLTRVSSEQAR